MIDDDERKSMIAAGLTLVELWVFPEQVEPLRRFVKQQTKILGVSREAALTPHPNFDGKMRAWFKKQAETQSVVDAFGPIFAQMGEPDNLK